MSEFDREAERERLREKYEHDKQKREATERMSELLLQGATMTNAHCSECGDPIFRYDGQEFCATCERPVERTQPDDEDATEGNDGIEVTTPDDRTRVQFGDGSASEETNGQSGQQSGDGQPTEHIRAGQPPEHTERPTPAESQQPSQPAPPGRNQSGDADIEAARKSLTRTLVTFSHRAEATDDPRRAREHLQAAREAAETLAALR